MLKSRRRKLSPLSFIFFNLSETIISNFLTQFDNEFIANSSERRRLILLWLSWGTLSKLLLPTASCMDFKQPLLNCTKSFVKIALAPSGLGTKTWVLPKILVLNHFPCLVTLHVYIRSDKHINRQIDQQINRYERKVQKILEAAKSDKVIATFGAVCCREKREGFTNERQPKIARYLSIDFTQISPELGDQKRDSYRQYHQLQNRIFAIFPVEELFHQWLQHIVEQNGRRSRSPRS